MNSYLGNIEYPGELLEAAIRVELHYDLSIRAQHSTTLPIRANLRAGNVSQLVRPD